MHASPTADSVVSRAVAPIAARPPSESRAPRAARRAGRLRAAAIAAVMAPGALSPLALVTLAGMSTSAHAQPSPAVPAAAKPADLPIKAITLYRSGVGSFERRGLVDGDRLVQLRFANEHINDILKSMVILTDPASGRVASVSYGSKDPLDKRLGSFGINIADNPSAGEILSRLRGSPVAIRTDEGETTGTILNVETRPTVLAASTPGGPATVAQLPWINLVTDRGVRSINLTRAVGFEILDPKLNEELGKALAALAEHRADRVKAVDVSFAGQGAFPAAIGYVHEMPMWKTSYRLVLAEPASDGKDSGRPTMQGWALVENSTDEDWEGVKLSLVAGRPISFTMDLYEPLYVSRPELPVPMVGGVAPRLYQSAEAFQQMQELRNQAAKSSQRAGAMARRESWEQSRAVPAAAPGGLADAVDMAGEGGTLAPPPAAAQAGEVGEVFQYQLTEPVSIARQRSAMLPILSAAIDGRRVSIYSRADGSEHPMRGVELKNDTGLQLMPGPVTVFDGPAYAGDAQINHVSTGDKRLLAYAVDLDVRALVTDQSASSLRGIVIANGMLQQTWRERQGVTYAFSSKDAKRARTVLVEHPKMGSDWSIVPVEPGGQAAKPSQETQSLYRFELALPPGGKAALPLAFERTTSQVVAVTSMSVEQLVAHARDGKVSKAVVDAVKKAADMQGAINDTQRRLQQLDAERQAIDADQARIRQNIGSVGRDTDLYRRYTAKLAEQESRLEAIHEQRGKEQETLNRQQADLNAYLGSLNVE